ncbi:hypothetical protein Enr13x_32570 [Stieleria neptunia]|uniref:Uncharacterized protein n=2 Tax=Stieleria neptunia TaxID=2527979 RepID=A0A518HRI7_9BACT|nr:hypothetical protein Enr13x_32570 [Stieleria neptunia]
MVQTMEQRSLLAADVSFDFQSRELRITGGDLADHVDIRDLGNGSVRISIQSEGAGAESFEYPSSAISWVHFKALGGNDEFRNVSELPSLVHGGEGSDVLHGGSSVDVFFGEAPRCRDWCHK